MCANSAAMNPPPDDDDPFGKRLHPHHRVARVDASLGVDAVQALDVQQPRSAAGSDDPPVRGDRDAGAGVEGHRPGEPGRLAVDRDVVGLLAVGLAVGGDRVDPAEDPVADGRPVGPDAVDVDAEPGRLAGLDDPVGRQDEHLRRDAPHVEAGATEATLLDQADVEVVQARGDDGVARPRADDDEVVVAVLHVAQRNFAPRPPRGRSAGQVRAPAARAWHASSVHTERGFDRIVNFSDATVAIAMTLLVLPLVELGGDTEPGRQPLAPAQRELERDLRLRPQLPRHLVDVGQPPPGHGVLRRLRLDRPRRCTCCGC